MDIIANASYMNVDLYFFIPLVNIRNTTESGLLRFVSIFRGQEAAKVGPKAASLLCKTASATMDPLQSGLNDIAKAHAIAKDALPVSAIEKLNGT